MKQQDISGLLVVQGKAHHPSFLMDMHACIVILHAMQS